jgi:glycosyltransferase involved in cell wall biosynthesis
MIAFAASSASGSTMPTGLSICIPVYNERDAIAETLKRCLALKPDLERVGVNELEVIAVDDGSKDGSAEAIAAFPQVRLIRHQVNRGYGAALKTGFAAASHELVGFLDGDATYPPEQFPNLVREIVEDRADLVIGSRLAGAETEMPLIRRIGNLFFARLLTIIGRAAVSDSASGMRVFKKSTSSNDRFLIASVRASRS